LNRMKDIPLFSSKTQKSIAKQVLLGFAVTILLGSLILSIPGMVQDNNRISYIDALFTSTSAICVTGLVVQDTPTYFSDLGKIVILLFIQIGGLGIMTIGSIFGIILGRKINIKDKFYLSTSFGSKQPFSAGKFFMVIAATTFTIEFIGFILMALIFFFRYGYPVGTSMTFSLFHTVSAFNNAGFSLYSNSLETFIGDIPLNIVFMALIFLGGIGFPVLSEIITYRRRRNFTLHSRIVLITSGLLIIAGALLFYLLELNNPQTTGNTTLGTKIVASFFQSVTARTAGFNTTKIGALNPSTLLILTVLMFIGASPGGTGGGIKTTTFVTVVSAGFSSLVGRRGVTLLKRKLPDSLIFRALTLTIIALIVIILATMGILAFEKCTFNNALFEAVSAFGTVGLSTGITPTLSTGSKIILILSMFIGRIGISTLSLAIAIRGTVDKMTYPEDSITIG
ncbi:MAG: Trk family potassium uptake protein, partial [Actinobacteria bacterium]|nr:Trk family potassium uptake protein [Actinomycetota bacterium]